MAKSKSGIGSRLPVIGGHDPDLQAGSKGMKPTEAAARYLKSPGHFLAILRFFHDESLDDVSKGSDVPADLIKAYEKGTKSPSLKDLASLASHFEADLRILLEVFGHVADDAADTSWGIAAQFSGELDANEKVSLQELVRRFRRAGSEEDS